MTGTNERVIRGNYEASVSANGSCPECGFHWSLAPTDAKGVVLAAPERYRLLLGDRLADARRAPAPGIWSPSAYVWHVADALGIWAERVRTLLDDPGAPIVPFDQDVLAAARRYDALSPVAGWWALARRVSDLEEVLGETDTEAGFVHPDFGAWTIAALLRYLAHEIHHHDLDIRRGFGATG